MKNVDKNQKDEYFLEEICQKSNSGLMFRRQDFGGDLRKRDENLILINGRFLTTQNHLVFTKLRLMPKNR